MGCCFSSVETGAAAQQHRPQDERAAAAAVAAPSAAPSKREAPTKQYNKPRWKSPKPLTPAGLQALREEFWDTQPHYGGDRVIWDAIRAACEAPDMATTRLLLEAAGVIVARPDMSVMYDERGARYALPPYVLCAPSNLAPGADAAAAHAAPSHIQLQPRGAAAG